MSLRGSLSLITMTQLSRLISILTMLKSKRILTATELAQKYDVSVRTIYRDIKKLIDAGVPVVTIEGKGYTLMDGYTIAPVQFTEMQANALITAQHLVSKSNDSSFVADFNEALIKIKSVFKSKVLEKSELLHNKIHVFDTREKNIASNALSEIQLAITNYNFIEINYQKADDPNVSFRKIEPYAIFSTQNKWILIAWCYFRLEYRAFRVDRIKHFKILPDVFEDRQFNIQSFFRNDPYDIKKGERIKTSKD